MWDTLFPNRRDVFALGPLPVESRVQSAGRLGGLLTLFGLFAIALNVLPALLFPIVSGGDFLGIVRGTVGHVIAALAANCFRFFGSDERPGHIDRRDAAVGPPSAWRR